MWSREGCEKYILIQTQKLEEHFHVCYRSTLLSMKTHELHSIYSRNEEVSLVLVGLGYTAQTSLRNGWGQSFVILKTLGICVTCGFLSCVEGHFTGSGCLKL